MSRATLLYAVCKLDPRVRVRNPVMLMVPVCALLTLLFFVLMPGAPQNFVK